MIDDTHERRARSLVGVVGREAVANMLEPSAERSPREQDQLEIGVGRGSLTSDDPREQGCHRR